MSRIRLSNTPAFEPKQDEMTVPPTDSHSERSKLLAMLDDFSPAKTNEVSPAKTVDVSVTDNADIEISRANVSATDTYRSENVSSTDTYRSENVSATDKSRGKYKNQYTKDHYDTLRVNLPKGAKAKLTVSATERGVSVTEMVKEALIQYLGDETREWLR